MKRIQALVAFFTLLGSTTLSLPKSVLSRKVIRNVTKYISGNSAELSANGGEVLLPSQLKTTGITNFDKGNIIATGKDLVVTGIRILFSNTGTDPKTATWKDEAPACWKNGEFTVSQDGQGDLFTTSGTDITNWKASTGNEDDFRDVFFRLRPDVPFNIKALLVGTATGLYKVEFRAEELVAEGQS